MIENLDFRNMKEEDTRLVNFVRTWLLESPPSIESGLARKVWKNSDLNGQIGQPAIVDALLNQQENGFFIECGAYDGVSLSNSLFFEVKRGWTGLLIEPNMAAYVMLKRSGRKVYLVPIIVHCKFS